MADGLEFSATELAALEAEAAKGRKPVRRKEVKPPLARFVEPVAVPVAEATRRIVLSPRRFALYELAQEQVTEIAVFDEALRKALALAAAGGSQDKLDRREPRKREYYEALKSASADLDRFADGIFFEHLWQRFDAADEDACENVKRAFVGLLWERTQAIFGRALPAMPCSSLFRPRAEARAKAALRGAVMKNFQSYLRPDTQNEEVTNDAV